MYTKRLPHLVALSIFAIWLAGCGDSMTGADSNPAASTDEGAIGLLVAEDTETFGTDIEMSAIDSPAGRALATGRPGLHGEPIDAFWFRRLIRSQDVTRDIHIEHPSDGPAVADLTVTRDMRGAFRLFFDNDESDGILAEWLDKRLEATATRNAVLMQRGGDRHRGWQVVAVSGVEIVSNPSTKVIQSVEFESDSVLLTITDPLELVRTADLPMFAPGEEVTITVTTNDESDFVFLHTWGPKREFEALGGGVFQTVWTVGPRRAHDRRLAVDVIDDATLLDDTSPYDSVIWGFHYRIGDGVLSDDGGPADPPGR